MTPYRSLIDDAPPVSAEEARAQLAAAGALPESDPSRLERIRHAQEWLALFESPPSDGIDVEAALRIFGENMARGD